MSSSKNRARNTPTTRRIVFRLLLRNFDSIRLVSINLKKLLRFDYERLESKTFVSPVYVPTSATALTSNRLKNTIIVLGRLHIERNPLEALKTVSHVLINNPLVRLDVVGDGPLQSEVLKYCEKEMNSHSYTFWGQLPHEEALRVLTSSSVLLSSAPHEGYGLSIREALTCGVPVVARSNPETIGLARSWPKILCTYDTVAEAAKLVAHYLQAPPEEADFSEFRAKLISESVRDLQILTRRWVELINQQN
jgi:glycosyltransferase involved in cell wall biosynthesis